MTRNHAGLAIAVLLLILVALLTTRCGREVQPPVLPPPPVFVPPLHDAVAGEELIHRRGPQTWQYNVLSVSDTEVEVQLIVREGDLPIREPERFTWHRNSLGLPDDTVVRKLERARLEVGGRVWDCWLAHVYTRERGNFYYYYSEKVAGPGWLKIARNENGRPDDSSAYLWETDSLTEAVGD